MSDAIQRPQPTLFRRMWHTPVRDALRGKITGRLDLHTAIEASGLPQPARDLIRRVVARTRLWRIERADVTNELIAHFTDGIAAGQTPEELLASFGDERCAAKLIRRAKRRNRPLPWHAMVWTGRGIAALLLIYLALTAYYISFKPSPSVDYVAQANERIAKVPQDQRAWPIYREAFLKAGLQRYLTGDSILEFAQIIDERPGTSNWPKFRDWLSERTAAFELVRSAADKPALGLPLLMNDQVTDPALVPPGSHRPPPDETEKLTGPLNNVSQAHLLALSWLSQALTGDARLAIETGGLDRAIGDVAALHAMAVQLREHEIIGSTGIVALNIRVKSVDVAHALLASARERLSVGQLQRLSHVFAGESEARDVLSLAAARAYTMDLIQRVYSDDGHGDGRLTPRGTEVLTVTNGSAFGFKRLEKLSFLFADPKSTMRTFHTVAGPLFPMFIASRRDATETATRILDLAQANLARPIRDADWTAYLQEYERLHADEMSRAFSAAVFVPAADSYHVSAERYLAERDGLIIGAAIESYRRASDGRLPANLNVLVPAFLPRLPVDRMTGGSLHYRISDGKPIVYSVGDDHDDDNGRQPISASGVPQPWTVSRWPHRGETPVDGDWQLYPQTTVEPSDAPTGE